MDHHSPEPYQRLPHLDVLRGFALFGILLVNVEWFSRSTQAMLLGSSTDLQGVDYLAGRLIAWLAESKFFPLFSMLFGMGFAIMVQRARKADRPFVGMYLRRLLALALFGLAHIAFVWSGDILLMYALVALIMLVFFRQTPPRRLYKWAIACWVIPLLFTGVSALLFAVLPEEHDIRVETLAAMQEDYQALMARIAEAERIHQEGGFGENLRQRREDMHVLFADFSFFLIPMVLGYFLFGRWLIESGIMERPDQHGPWLRRWQRWGLLLGLPAALAAMPLMHDAHLKLPDRHLVLGLLLYLIGSVGLSLAYLILITRQAGRLRFLAPVGRMALTNYLLQSLFWTTVFYGYGLGWWGQISRTLQVPLALLFFTGQILGSRWWMARHRHGPMEWLWRVLTRWPRPV
jgi:uncharacterized protein